MISSISSTAQDSIQLMMQQMLGKISAADTDGTVGLSKDELSAIDSTGNVGTSTFLKSLSEQFDTLDADGNGQLTADEISAARPPEPMGPPPGLTISDNSDTSSSSSDLIQQLLESILDNLAESYGDESSESTAENKINSLTSSADADSNGSLSMSELSSINFDDNEGQTGFVKDLMTNFENYDTDSDGQLSSDEMLSAMPKEQTNLTDGANSLKSLASSFIEKLLDVYKNSDMQSKLSALIETV